MHLLLALFLNVSLLPGMQSVEFTDPGNIYIFDDGISIEEARSLGELAEQIICKTRSTDRVGMAKLFVDSPEPWAFSLEARWEAVEDDMIRKKIFDENSKGTVADLIGTGGVQILFLKVDIDSDPGTRHFEIYFIPRSAQEVEFDGVVAAIKWISNHKWLTDYHAILVGLTSTNDPYLPQGYFYFETDGPILRGMYSHKP